ncbi:MAG TPA: type II toxin-antitoxin system RelE/ParE family toxin [Gemmataceae bacterium]|nr:type II toxin-antitoxin system RelE/ParE family toxin [Gemmataceae bacterium]
MSRSIVVRPRASVDLDEQAEYIAQDNPKAALRFLNAAEKAFAFLADMPELGAACEFRNPAAAGLRMWLIRGFEKHVIFYRSTETGIDVIRVLHAARDIEAFFGN